MDGFIIIIVEVNSAAAQKMWDLFARRGRAGTRGWWVGGVGQLLVLHSSSQELLHF